MQMVASSLQIKRLVGLMNSSAKTTTVFQITGDVTAKMTVVIIQMKKTAVSKSCSLFNKPGGNFFYTDKLSI